MFYKTVAGSSAGAATIIIFREISRWEGGGGCFFFFRQKNDEEEKNDPKKESVKFGNKASISQRGEILILKPAQLGLLSRADN